MKPTSRSTAAVTSPLFYTYLKPGALALLRYSKISARSRAIHAQTLLDLCQLELSSDSAPHSADLAVDGMPCFDFRVRKYPRCIQRKKLVAVAPFFSSET